MKPRKKQKSDGNTADSELSEQPQKKRCLDGCSKLIAVEKFLKTQVAPQLGNSQDKQTFLRFAAKFQLFDDILYYIGIEGEVKRKVIFSQEDRIQVLKECHEIPSTGRHFGLSRTQKNLVQSFYWTEITEDVRKWVLGCELCQTPKKSPYQTHVKKEVKPVKTNGIWEMVGVDVIGPFTRTVSGMAYICIATDVYTKFVVAIPVPDKTPASVARALLKMVYSQGAPKKFLVDQSKKYLQKLIDGVSDMFHVEYANAETYHHSLTGHDDTVEILIPEIIMYAQMGYQDNWDDYLPSITYAFNTTVNTTNNVTPFFMMYGRNPNLVSGSACKTDNGHGVTKALQKENCKNCIENMTKMHEKVVRNIRKSQIIQRNKPECFNLKVGKFLASEPNAGNENSDKTLSINQDGAGFDYFPPQDSQRAEPQESQTCSMTSGQWGFYSESSPGGSRTTSHDMKMSHLIHPYHISVPVMPSYQHQPAVQYNGNNPNFDNHSQIS